MTMQEQLNQYYKDVGIAPVVPKDVGITPVDSMEDRQKKMFSAFCCEKKKKEACKEACKKAYEKKISTTEGFLFEPRVEGVTISQEYQDRNYHGKRIPRIVVLSLSAPQPNPGHLSIPQPKEEQDKPAANSKTYLDPDRHWSRTLVTVRSLLHPFIPDKFPKPVEYWEDGQEIEKLFVHVRTAKCCSNANGAGAEPPKVYANCGGYLGEELSILKPDVIVTQGNPARDRAKQHAFNAIEQVKGLDLERLERPIAHIVNLKEGNRRVYWLPMTFPAKQWRKWMERWDKEAGPAIESESNGVDEKRAKREHLVLYGKKIKKFIKDR